VNEIERLEKHKQNACREQTIHTSNNYTDWWQSGGILVEFRSGAHAVLQQLEEHVVDVRWNVRERLALLAIQRDLWGAIEGSIANQRRTGDGVLRNLARTGLDANDTGMSSTRRALQLEMVCNQRSNSNATQVELVELFVQVVVVAQIVGQRCSKQRRAIAKLRVQLVETARHHKMQSRMACVDHLETARKVGLLIVGAYRFGEALQLAEGLGVHGAHSKNRRHDAHAVGKAFETRQLTSKTDWNLPTNNNAQAATQYE
jgi:hypothetical protein